MWLQNVRDVAIVLLALETLVIGALLAITLLQIRSLVRVLRDEVLPMLQSATDTVNTVKGTTRFVSDSVVHPIVRSPASRQGRCRRCGPGVHRAAGGSANGPGEEG